MASYPRCGCIIPSPILNRIYNEVASLDDNTPLPELSFEDFLEPTQEETATQHHMEIDALDSDGDGAGGDKHSISIKESLNTPQFKRTVVTILEDKRLRSPGPAVLKSHAIKVVTAGAGSVAPIKPQITDIKVLNNFKPLSSNTVKIGNTTVAPTSPSGGTPKGLNSLTMTQIKTPDGKILYLQKSMPAEAAAKPVVAASTPSMPKAAVTVSSAGAVHHLVAPTGLQKAILSKDVNVGSTGLVKAAVPGKGGTSASTPLTIKGITPLGAKSVLPANSPTSTPAAKFQVVRTSDGKIIKINQASPSMIINTKANTTTTPGTGINAATSAFKLAPSTGSVGLRKSIGQVVIRATPPKHGPDVSNSSTLTTGTSVTTNNASAPPGKMLVQNTGKQIVVSNKNIIKLSPKPGAASSITNTSGAQGNSPTKGIHAVQIPGKGGVVQYVRVLPSTKEAASTSSASAVARSNSSPKITFVRSVMSTATSSKSPSTPTSVGTKVVSVGNTNKIIMKTTGGSIVPLPSIQTFVSKRALGATNTRPPSVGSGNSGSQESPRKQGLNDLNIQHLAAADDASDSSEAGPEKKRPRLVISVPQSSQKQQLQKHVITRPSSIQRVTVQGANSNKSSTNPAKKVYNLVQSPKGVKYMIYNSGIPQSSTSAMRRGYTGYVDGKTRRPLSIAAQQATTLQALQAQAKQRIRQQQLQNQPFAVQPKATQATVQPSQANANPNPQSAKILPEKPLFEILKSPQLDSAPTTDALAGMASRRKHCNCSKSQCLKLYCDCFANGEFCQDCTCKDCFNNLDYEVERERAIRSCLDRNPSAFKPKITAPNSGDMRLHNKGCNCKRSGCLKNYCECYEAKIPCSSMCKCVGCRNMEDRPDVDMDSMDSLVDGEDSKKAKDGNDKQSQDDSDRYLTDDVVDATIMCMISRLVMHEKQNTALEDTEREVMEELGESLSQIISFGKEKIDTNELVDSMALDS
ncbi:protein lin-54 homolog isoform X3 [Drosophila miranda]|uniref:protein lin-54 homolog isoform X3 n=1 Tax=Drosophila miranda TaxID=7229 RepID=UPI0007E6DFA7|nr:protein lin-54 homolog isoform X3 [Drosophila miranda]XP_017147255.1 protein lin-54 homolog isoform X3 [Drosophila miranda]